MEGGHAGPGTRHVSTLPGAEAAGEGPAVIGGVVVMLAYYFPPLVGIAAERMAVYSRRLPEFGWTPTVIAPRSGFFHRASESDGPARAVETHSPVVIRTRSLELSRILRRSFAGATGLHPGDSSDIKPIPAGRVGRSLRRLVRDLLYIPDAQLGWIPFASRAALGAIQRARATGPCVLFSSSVPYSAHLAALRAARRLDVPWVAEFRDPWSEAHPNLKEGAAWRWRLNERIHAHVLRAADHVVVTSKSTKESLVSRFSLAPEGITVVMNGFEPMPDAQPPAPDEHFMLVYAGTVAPLERVQPLLEALDGLFERVGPLFRLRVLGPSGPWESDASAPPRPWLQLDGLVIPDRAREAMAGASANVLIRAHEAYASILPGKLFEYLGARRPVLAAVVPGSEMEDLISAHGDGRLVVPNESAAFRSELERLLQEHRRGELQQPRVPSALVESLQRRSQTGRLAGVFDELVGVGSSPR